VGEDERPSPNKARFAAVSRYSTLQQQLLEE
jgi:hypothetical protein